MWRQAIPIAAAIVALSCACAPAVAQAQDEKQGPGGTFLVGVMPFDAVGSTQRGMDNALERLAVVATDRTRTGFAQIPRLRLIDEEHMAEAQRLIARSATRDADQEYRLAVGRQLHARYVCFGRVTATTSECRNVEKQSVRLVQVTLTLTVLDVTTSTVVSDENVTVVNHDLVKNVGHDPAQVAFTLGAAAVEHAAKAAVREVANRFPIETTIVAVEKDRALIALGTEGGVEKGMKFAVMRATTTAMTPEGVAVPAPEEQVAEVQVSVAGAKSAWVGGNKRLKVGDRVVMRPKHASGLWTFNEFMKFPPCAP